ncbi:MAG: glycosyl transferase, partial [Pseudomonadota bacterium]
TPLLAWLEERLAAQGTSVDEVIASTQTRLGASNVTMRNIVTSMRLASEMDWADFFEDVSLVEATLRGNPTYAAMDFATRNSYRTEIEILSKNASLTEDEVADRALVLASAGDQPHKRDPGYWLIGDGRAELEAATQYRPPHLQTLVRRVGSIGLAGYLAAIAVTTGLVLFLTLTFMAAAGTGPIVLFVLAIVGALPASELATAIVNTVITRSVPPKLLPGLDLAKSIPPHLRTLVAVPVLLRQVDDIADEIERLEVHHLSSTGGAVHYALLSDGPDSDAETTAEDERLITVATEAMARLNERYPGEDGDRFHFLHRQRLWNAAEGVWMGWERKRGKLAELNRLLRGATDTSYSI